MKKILTKVYKPRLFIVLLVFFLCSTVVISVQASTFGVEMSEYQQKENILSKQVKDLEDELVLLSSLTNNLQESEKLGLVRPMKVYYLKPLDNFASR